MSWTRLFLVMGILVVSVSSTSATNDPVPPYDPDYLFIGSNGNVHFCPDVYFQHHHEPGFYVLVQKVPGGNLPQWKGPFKSKDEFAAAQSHLRELGYQLLAFNEIR